MQKGSHNQAAPKRKGRPPKSEGVKRPHYLSINEQEFERLRQLGFRERWAYMEIKKISNWKTGACGEFDNQRLSYAQIARLVTAPPEVQGRGNGSIDDTQASDFIQRFAEVGLVTNIGRRANGGLRFDMPFSPIQSKEPALSGKVTPPPSGEIPVIFPDHVLSKNVETPFLTRAYDDLAYPLSVMINKDLNINNDGADSAPAEPAPCRVSDAAPVLENLQVQPASAPMLTGKQIMEAVCENWDFAHSGYTQEAIKLYESWDYAGVTLDELHAAMTSVEHGADRPEWPTPADINKKLWTMLAHRWADRLPA